MSGVGRREVLALYRSLLRYRKTLRLTDKDYYSRRIRQEFEQRREEQDIDFYYRVSRPPPTPTPTPH